MPYSEQTAKITYWQAMFRLKCPRCREGEMFIYNNPYRKFSFKKITAMHKTCPVCKQKFDLEPGFWFGTAYVSYALFVMLSCVSFFLWWLIFGISLKDNRLEYWLITNLLLCSGFLPLLMRYSRWIYLNIFVQYDKNWKTNEGIRIA